MKETKTHIYFWGGIFSQWYSSEIKFQDHLGNEKIASTAEAYMMHKKAILFNAPKIAKKILLSKDPKEQKNLGQDTSEIKFNQEIWDKEKFNIIVKGNLLKFSQNEKLKKSLIETGDKILVEGSPLDLVYGVGLKWNDPRILDENNWRGENLLGKALMKVREILIFKEKNRLAINAFLKRKIYNSEEEIIYNALKLLVNEQKRKEANNRREQFSDETYQNQTKEYHEWYSNKDDKFRSCKKCGIVENNKNTNENCISKVEIKLRLSDRDFDKVGKELENPSDTNEAFTKIAKENKDLLKNLEEGMKNVREGNGMSTSELKNKILEKAKERVDNLPDNWFEGKPLLVEIQGSILDAKEDIIAQGCNCSGASGAGIAKFIGKEYPESDKKYKEMCKNKNFKLGTVMFNEEKGKIQAFCGTQQYYGKFLKMDENSIEKRYEAIEECLLKIYEKAKKENLSVALPRIGCGRARADWNRVKNIIKKVFHDYPVTIYWIPDRYSKS